MKPLPKWVSKLALAVTAIIGLEQTGALALLPDQLEVWVLAAVNALAAFSHSLTGSGGKRI